MTVLLLFRPGILTYDGGKNYFFWHSYVYLYIFGAADYQVSAVWLE